MYIILDVMYMTMSISTGLCPDWDLWTANRLQLQLQLVYIDSFCVVTVAVWRDQMTN
jgi:hypothetical protein